MTCTAQQMDVVSNILSSAIAIGSPSSTTPNKAKSVPHKAGKTTSSTKKRSWKKPKDKPKRPLSAYNLFFKEERARLIAGAAAAKNDLPSSRGGGGSGSVSEATKRKHRKSHGKIGFAALAQNIAAKWKTIDAATRRPFEEKASVEKARYRRELDQWNKVQKEKKLNSESEASMTVAATCPTVAVVTPSKQKPRVVKSTPSKAATKNKKPTATRTAESTSCSSKDQDDDNDKLEPKEPLALPSNMPFYPMNLKGSPTSANIAPITLQSLVMPTACTSSSSSSSSASFPVSNMTNESMSFAMQMHAISSSINTGSALPVLPVATTSSSFAPTSTKPVTPEGSPRSSCVNSQVEESDLLDDLNGSIDSIFDDIGDFAPLSVFPTVGGGTEEGVQQQHDQLMTMMQNDMSMDRLMDGIGDFDDFLAA